MSAPSEFRTWTPPAVAVVGSRRTAASGERGVAALVVVMVLFFIVSLVAAYSSRNLIFEQRTSANQYRSTAALDAADAGLEWALSLLNSGRIDGACNKTTKLAAAPNDTFRQRYLNINDDTNGGVTVKLSPDGVTELWPSCVFSAGAWTCGCPNDGAPVLAGDGPAFRVRFLQLPAPRAGTIRVEARGCTSVDIQCLTFPAPHATECRGTACAVVSLFSGLKAPPTAAITARGTVAVVGGAVLTAVNSSAVGSGISIHAVGPFDTTGMTLVGRPGSPANLSMVDGGASLSAPSFTPDRMFAGFFGLLPATYQEQPGAVVVDCGGGCLWTADVRDVVRDNPGRVIWLTGNMDFDAAGNACFDAVANLPDPCVIVSTGNITFSAATTVYGLIYSHAATWATAGAGTIRGAAGASGAIAVNGSPTVVFDAELLTRLRYTSGSFARVPGSWKDIP